MNYKFERYNYFDERDQLHKSTSIIILENEEDYGVYFITEITNLRLDYLDEIVTSLEQVQLGNLQKYDFGYEVYSIISKRKTSEIVDLYNDWEIVAEIPTRGLYEFLRDWRNYQIENPTVVIEPNKVYSTNVEEITFRCVFFDGLQTHQFNNQYDDWLSSSNASIWINSYVEIQNKRIYIVNENVKALSTFRYYNKKELELIALQYCLKVREENGIYYAYTEDRGLRQFQISENDQLAVIYCIEGSNNPESIFIYNVTEKS